MKSGQMRGVGFVALVLFLREVVWCQTENSCHDSRRGLLIMVLISIKAFLTELRKRPFLAILRGGM